MNFLFGGGENTCVGYPDEITELYKLPCTKERNDKIDELHRKYNINLTGWGGVAIGNCSYCGDAYSKHPGGYFNHDTSKNIAVGNNEHS